MEIPFAEKVIQLDFLSTDFQPTVPATL